MEQLSNNIHCLMAKAIEEVSIVALKEDEKLIISLSEFPAIAGFPFKVILIQDQQGTIKSYFKQWDAQYDMNRWKLGIYNLDRLRIITDSYCFSESEKEKLEIILSNIKSKKLPKDLQNYNAIPLDSSDWQLKIATNEIDVNYTWKVAIEDIAIFIPLIVLIARLCMNKSKRAI